MKMLLKSFFKLSIGEVFNYFVIEFAYIVLQS